MFCVTTGVNKDDLLDYSRGNHSSCGPGAPLSLQCEKEALNQVIHSYPFSLIFSCASVIFLYWAQVKAVYT